MWRHSETVNPSALRRKSSNPILLALAYKSNAPRDSAAHRPYSRGKGDRQVFCRRRHSTLQLIAQGAHLIVIEALDENAGRALSEEKCIPVIGKRFKSHRDYLRRLVDVLQNALPP